MPNGAGTSEVWCVCFEKIQVTRWSCVYFFLLGVVWRLDLPVFKKKHRYFLSRVTVSFPGWLQPRNANLGPQFCFLNSYWFTSSRSRTPGSKRSNWICWVPWFLPHLAGAQTLWPSVKAKGLARAEVDEDSTSSMAWSCHPCQCQPWKRHHQGQEERRKVWKDLLGGHQAETQVKLNAPWMVFQDQPKSTTRPIKKVKQWNWKDYKKAQLAIFVAFWERFCSTWNIETANIDPSFQEALWRLQAPQRNHKSLHRKNWQVRTVGACRVPGSMTSGQQIYLTISLLHVYQECTATIDSKEWNVNMVCIYTCKTFLIDQIMAQFWGGKDFSSIQKYKHVYVTYFWILCFEMIWIPKQLFWILRLCWIYVSSFWSRSW